VSDIRFPDEAQTIRDLGGIIIRIVRYDSHPTDTASLHISESGQDEIAHDFLIDNNSDTKSLHSAIDSILQSQLLYYSQCTECTSQGQSQ